MPASAPEVEADGTNRRPSDEDLLGQVAQADRAALADMYDRYAPRLYGLILKIVRDRADADDVLQQVFWHVWQQGGAYDRRLASPAVWLILIARSRAVDCLRRRRRRPTAPLEDGRDEMVDRRGPGAAEAETARAQAALATLPAEQREVICLSFYCGLSHIQIAENLNLPLGTVKTRIRLGMSKLRELLDERREVSRP